MIDLSACKTHGVTVTNVPAASNESVAEHAIALFFALRRNIVGMHDITRGGEEWVKKYSLKDEFGFCPGTCKEEVVGILGGGELGIRSCSFPLFYHPHLLSRFPLSEERAGKEKMVT
jgi:lactate dehydrogenase-like 2-hydroxyacid dehydrogenase